jgi:hypothetical protein
MMHLPALGHRRRVNLEGNIKIKYKDRIRQLNDLLVRRACKTSPISVDIFELSERSILMPPKCWHDVKREDISDRWS